MKTITYYIILLFILYSCSNRSDYKRNTCAIPVNITQENVLKMSDFIESVQYIPLETSDSSLIGEVSDIFPLEDKIAIIDKRHTHSIYFYDYNGKFLYKINKQGAGPGEYVKISSVDVDEKENRIYLYDTSLRKILVYTLQGQYVTDFTMNFQFSSMDYLGNGLLACYTDYYRGDHLLLEEHKKPLLVIYNMRKGEIQERAFYEDAAIQMTETIGLDSNFSQFERGSLFFYYLNDHIYQLDKNGHTELALKLELGTENEKRIAAYKTYLMENNLSAVDIDRNKANIFTMRNAVGNKDFLLCYYNNFKTYAEGVCFYSCKDRKVYSGLAKGKIPIMNDVDGGCPLIARTLRGNDFFAVLQPIEVEMYQEKCEALKKLEIMEESNPVIMIATVRKYV